MNVMCLAVVYFIGYINDPATTESYTYRHTRSLHDALPIFVAQVAHGRLLAYDGEFGARHIRVVHRLGGRDAVHVDVAVGAVLRARPAADAPRQIGRANV